MSVCAFARLSVSVLSSCKLNMGPHDLTHKRIMSWKANLLLVLSSMFIVTHKRAQNIDFGVSEAYFGPELDGKGDGLHGVGVPPDEEPPKQNPRQPIPLGVQVSQVTDVVGHHPEQFQIPLKMMK